MANEDIATYLANVILVSRADEEVHPLEKEAIESMRQGIGAR